jgi:DNA (cytosine-5)-methyltransferase 1
MRAIDLFCGAGGSSLGAAVAGAEIVAGFDIWPVAGQVYRANFPRARCYSCDLAALDESDVRSLCADLGDVDLILASPPCTDHSSARGARPPSPAGLDLPWCVWEFCSESSNRAGSLLRTCPRCAGGMAIVRLCTR